MRSHRAESCRELHRKRDGRVRFASVRSTSGQYLTRLCLQLTPDLSKYTEPLLIDLKKIYARQCSSSRLIGENERFTQYGGAAQRKNICWTYPHARQCTVNFIDAAYKCSNIFVHSYSTPRRIEARCEWTSCHRQAVQSDYWKSHFKSSYNAWLHVSIELPVRAQRVTPVQVV